MLKYIRTVEIMEPNLVEIKWARSCWPSYCQEFELKIRFKLNAITSQWSFKIKPNLNPWIWVAICIVKFTVDVYFNKDTSERQGVVHIVAEELIVLYDTQMVATSK